MCGRSAGIAWVEETGTQRADRGRSETTKIVCISRGSHGYGIELAKKLASRLGYACLAREALTDEATAAGIPVGRIETAIVKRRPLTEELEIAVDRFKAFVTEALCERLVSGDRIVYHGRTGHLVLPGISHVMRVRAIAAMEERIRLAMTRMNLSREKAKRYIEEVEEDRRRWVKTLYNVEWDDPALYDVVINTQHLSVPNAAAVLTEMAQLPEFQPTPASIQAVGDLLLAARCRTAIGRDARTAMVKAAVRAEMGRVSVTYLPRHAAQAAAIPDVLEKIEGIKSLICTVATTNILFLQEKFDPDSEALGDLIDLAEKWNAAVELVRLSAGEKPAMPDSQPLPVESGAREYDGGILEDDQAEPSSREEVPGLAETIDRLIRAGRAGGVRTLYGGPQELLQNLDRSRECSLIVVGDVFLKQPEMVRRRMTRDLIAVLAEKLRIPVVESSALKARYLFGPRQILALCGYGLAALLIYLGVFSFQGDVIAFLTSPGTLGRITAAAAVGVATPLVAWCLGGFYRNVLRLIRME
jgi:cytidylate kinase